MYAKKIPFIGTEAWEFFGLFCPLYGTIEEVKYFRFGPVIAQKGEV